jgi:hypothetical protein
VWRAFNTNSFLAQLQSLHVTEVEQRAPGVHQESPALSERIAQFFVGTFEDGEDPKSALGVSKAEQWGKESRLLRRCTDFLGSAVYARLESQSPSDPSGKDMPRS